MLKYTTESSKINSPQYNIFGDSFKVIISEIGPEEFTDGVNEIIGDKIVFDPPVEVETTKYKGESFFTISWDFGMSELLDADSWSCGMNTDAELQQKFVNCIIFHLEHAFFHVSCDPNYVAKHYALFGCLCLKGRAKRVSASGETQIIDEIP